MLMAENARTGFVWETFMKNPEATRGMQRRIQNLLSATGKSKTWTAVECRQSREFRGGFAPGLGSSVKPSPLLPEPEYLRRRPGGGGHRRNCRLGFRHYHRLKFCGGQNLFQLGKHLRRDLPA